MLRQGEFTRHPPEIQPRGAFDKFRVAFSLGTFFWRSKSKVPRCRAPPAYRLNFANIRCFDVKPVVENTYPFTTGIFPIFACHSAGPVWCTEVPRLSTATVTGMSFTSNS